MDALDLVLMSLLVGSSALLFLYSAYLALDMMRYEF